MTQVSIRTSAAAAGVIVGATWLLVPNSSAAATPKASEATPSVNVPFTLSAASASIAQDEVGPRTASSVCDAYRPTDVRVEVRSRPATLMADAEVEAAVYSACRTLRERLGAGYGYVVEEAHDPAEPEAEPRLFVFVTMQAADSAAANTVDEFILGDWGDQSERVRGIVRIGSEFI